MDKLIQRLLLLVSAAFLLFAPGCISQSQSHLQGVWKMDRIVDLKTKEISPGENWHYIFTEGYIMVVGGKQDRPVVKNNFAKMTHKEILSQLPAGGGFMSYEIKEGKIHRTTIFALSELFERKTL